MATKGTHNNGNHNGNGKSWHREFGLETTGLMAAEFASMVVSVGAFTFAGEWFPSVTKNVGHVVSKVCVEPYLDSIEWGLQKVCKIKECQPDFTKPREERAQKYGEYLTLFGLSAVAGVAAELGVRGAMNRWLGVKGANVAKGWKKYIPTGHDLAVVAVDRGVHIGAILATNTIGAKHADNAMDGITGFLQKSFGWPEERAKKAAEMLVVYEGPNWLGFGAATAYLAAHHHYHHSRT